jgi:LmbE family N-acetylglucosaminyl deacetylase
MHPLCFSSSSRILVFAPHPDDESLATGGVLWHASRAGAAIRVVFATSGESNPWPQRAAFRKWTIGERERRRWGALRRREARSALRALGVDETCAFFLKFPDYALTDLLVRNQAALQDRLRMHIEAFRPTMLFAPSLSDLHPDHNVLALHTGYALERSAVKDVLDLRYRIHGGSVAGPSGKIHHLVLGEPALAAKRRAVMAHATQMLLSRRRFMGYVTREELFFERPDEELQPALRVSLDDERRLHVYTPGHVLAGATLTLAASTGRAFQISLPGRLAGSGIRRRSARGADEAEIDIKPHSAVLKLPPEIDTGSMWMKLTDRWHFRDVSGWQRPLTPGKRTGRVCCVVPCYNVEKYCGAVVTAAACNADHVLAVDDGSCDNTRRVLEAIAASDPRVEVLVHTQNCGKGAALRSAFRYALANVDFGILVTLDGDSQHSPEDIPRLVAAMRRSGADLCIGERNAFKAMPLRSRIGNETTAALLRLLYPNSPQDTQSGFRAFSRSLAGVVAHEMEGRRYDLELRILLEALQAERAVATVPIETVYIDGNRSSHFDPVRDSLRIMWVLLKWQVAHLFSFERPAAKVFARPRVL